MVVQWESCDSANEATLSIIGLESPSRATQRPLKDDFVDSSDPNAQAAGVASKINPTFSLVKTGRTHFGGLRHTVIADNNLDADLLVDETSQMDAEIFLGQRNKLGVPIIASLSISAKRTSRRRSLRPRAGCMIELNPPAERR